MIKYIYVPLILLMMGLIGCLSSGKTATETEPHVSVTWELVSNLTQKKDEFEAKFVMTNNSKLTLTEENWALFFNMAPRPIVAHSKPQPASIQHINGDYYKLVPEKGFRLEPGATIEIHYMGTEGVIKETDAPVGLYFVFYGKKEQIVQVDDYRVKPFVRTEQIRRSRDDLEPLPTPEQTYRNNLGLSQLDTDAILKIIPTPVRVVAGARTFPLDNRLTIHYEKRFENEARFLKKKLEVLTGRSFRVSSTGPVAETGIYLRSGRVKVNDREEEAYRLQIGDNGIAITANGAAGAFYGVQSLLALIPAEHYLQASRSISLPFIMVEDAPRFAFRSLHLDVSRNFQTKETILRLLDLLAFYKINHFLFYTTEDEGWRLEIEGLPELTEVGAQRQHTASMHDPVMHPAYGSGPVANQNGRYGSGYYTRKDFIEILRYANERHIKVIPELNFPGHARAAIKAMEARYHRLMKEGKSEEAEKYRLVDPDDQSVYLSAQGYKDNVVSVARESTYRFYEKVVDEMAKMYQEAGLKMDVIHAGGDEVPEGAWTGSPLAAQLLKTQPDIKDPRNLQTYFFRELLKRLEKRNLTVHAWEETVLTKTATGKLAPNPEFVGRKVVPYIWNNMFDYPDLGYRLANAGYPVVLCNVSNFYFDLAYSNDPKEPGLYWAGFVDTRKAWTFAPYEMYRTTYTTHMGQPLDTGKEPAGWQSLKPEARKNILGVEAQLWSETIKGRDMMEYYLLPKLLGFAESAWAAERSWETISSTDRREQEIQAGWNRFANTLAQKELPRLARLNGGYNYRLPLPGAIIEQGTLKANVAFPGLTIRYTTDGTEPHIESAVYRGPVKASGTVKLKSFDASGRSSRTTLVQPQEVLTNR
ncbi:family 20 glycosylhydrolase [Telluribacter sp. SYSU D00476]|uniref:family 20 glycosylhydrolase n=1 Tax=Telluribacter sp. SYSU D00476 TaxID=2811430 RepID=UPI001FF1FE41|nr:family 20 glycosylhydrolase [Telluribacter sp. SYSU D00476]